MDFPLRLILTLICLGLVVILHEYGHFLVARYLGVRVERFTVGFGPEIVGWTYGATRYAICAVPLGGMVKLAGEFMDERTNSPDEFFSQAWYRRIAIALAGPVMNYALAFALFAAAALIWGVVQPSSRPVIGDIMPGLPAAEAHLEVGDTITAINHMPVRDWEQMADLIHGMAGQRVLLTVHRSVQSKPLFITLAPKADTQRGMGVIGILPEMEKIHVGFRASLGIGLHDIRAWTIQPLTYLYGKIRRGEGPKELSGPLGIAQMVSKATREGIAYVIYLMAVISTGLGLFNLFPIPILDGGHVFLYTIEGLIRRPLSRRVMAAANAVGLSVVMLIFLYASYQDVLRWRLGFWK